MFLIREGAREAVLPMRATDEAKRLVADGAKEITLLGQNVNSYGNDTDFSRSFAELVSRICAIDGSISASAL